MISLLVVNLAGGALWQPRDSLRFCSPHRVPCDLLTAFDAVVVALRGARVSTRPYVRPPAELPQRWAGGHAADDIGNKWVRPVGDRLVPLEPGNPWAHVLYAISHITTLPHVSHNVRMHSHDTKKSLVRGASRDFFLFPFSFFLCPLPAGAGAGGGDDGGIACLACARRRR